MTVLGDTVLAHFTLEWRQVTYSRYMILCAVDNADTVGLGVSRSISYILYTFTHVGGWFTVFYQIPK
jgi:hypothetical protein